MHILPSLFFFCFIYISLSFSFSRYDTNSDNYQIMLISVSLACQEEHTASVETAIHETELPAVELCLARPATTELWGLQVAAQPTRDVALRCVSGLPAAIALMDTPMALSLVRNLYSQCSLPARGELACECALCLSTHNTSLSSSTAPFSFLYAYNANAESHEAEAMCAMLAMSTLRRHLLLLLSQTDLTRACETDRSGDADGKLVPTRVENGQHGEGLVWGGDEVIAAVQANCTRIDLSKGGSHTPVEDGLCGIRVRWSAQLVCAVVQSWGQYMEARHAKDSAAALEEEDVWPNWVLLTASQDQGCHTAAAHSANEESGGEEEVSESLARDRNTTTETTTEPTHLVPAEDDMEAWSDADDASISDLDRASTPHKDDEEEADPAPEHDVSDRKPISCAALRRAGPSPPCLVTDIPPRATLGLARALYQADTTTQSKSGTVKLRCTRVSPLAESAHDQWLAAYVAKHLLTTFLLPADRLRDDGNDLLASQPGGDPDAKAEAAAAYHAGALLAQQGLTFPYMAPLHECRENGSYTSASDLHNFSAVAHGRCTASRDAAYVRADASDDTRANTAVVSFAEQRVWKPMTASGAAAGGIFASALLRAHALPPHAAVAPALAYMGPHAATRRPDVLHPCLAPALAAMAWRRADNTNAVGHVAPVTLLQLVWYTLHRLAIVLAANTAEATLRALAEASSSSSVPARPVTLGDLEMRARACEKASTLLWLLLAWQQPPGSPPEADAWPPTRSPAAQAELVWCFNMFSKLQLRAARLSKQAGNSERHRQSIWQLQEALRRWTNARTRRGATPVAASWRTVPESTAETLVCELSAAEWTELVASVENAITRI